MHQLYKHSGFKDSETLDLTDAEYKEVVRELEKHTAKKAKTEVRHGVKVIDKQLFLDLSIFILMGRIKSFFTLWVSE